MAEHDSRTDYAAADFYMDTSLIDDPYPYLEFLRAEGPVTRLPHHNAVAVTGFKEALDIYLDTEHFSSIVSVTGPIPPIPFVPDREDITDLIEQHRPTMLFGEEMLTMDPPRHTAPRSLMMRLFTPLRLKAMDLHIARIANQLLDEFEQHGACDFNAAFAKPFSSLAIADLLGVPADDREKFRENDPTATQIGARDEAPKNPMEDRAEKFQVYLEERRHAPCGDVMSDLATATYSDGSTPTLNEVVSVANLLFGAGQDTTAALVASAILVLAEQPDLQRRLREHPDRIPRFLEEVLRTAGPVKSTHRLARKATSLAGVEIPVGTVVMVSTAAINRDPAKFENPDVFDPDRPKLKEHLAFGRGPHTCPGAALARSEARIGLELILDRLDDIEIDEAFHGPAGERHYPYQPTYVFRALDELRIKFKSRKQTKRQEAV